MKTWIYVPKQKVKHGDGVCVYCMYVPLCRLGHSFVGLAQSVCILQCVTELYASVEELDTQTDTHHIIMHVSKPEDGLPPLGSTAVHKLLKSGSNIFSVLEIYVPFSNSTVVLLVY